MHVLQLALAASSKYLHEVYSFYQVFVNNISEQRPSDCGPSVSITLRCLAEALDASVFSVIDIRPPAEVLAQGVLVDQRGTVRTILDQRTLRSEPSCYTTVIVDRSANLKAAAEEILTSKTFFSGRSPYAPNCVLVNEFVEAEFLGLLHNALSTNDNSQTAKDDVGGKLCSKPITEPENIVSNSMGTMVGSLRIVKVSQRYQHSFPLEVPHWVR